MCGDCLKCLSNRVSLVSLGSSHSVLVRRHVLPSNLISAVLGYLVLKLLINVSFTFPYTNSQMTFDIYICSNQIPLVCSHLPSRHVLRQGYRMCSEWQAFYWTRQCSSKLGVSCCVHSPLLIISLPVSNF